MTRGVLIKGRHGRSRGQLTPALGLLERLRPQKEIYTSPAPFGWSIDWDHSLKTRVGRSMRLCWRHKGPPVHDLLAVIFGS